ncbi:MAG: hypothetical protein HBSAPP03_05780 [Phycisphaerae bacterium]|nr:MAG: hypothetical protein HBSAPP03_05780 [Phycisphaerae bacterium]
MDLGIWLVAVVLAQPQGTPPSRDPALTSPAVEDRLVEQQRKSLNTDPIAPVARPPAQTAIPGVPPPRGVTLSISGRARLPEGAFLDPTPGLIRRASTGDVIFDPLPRADGTPLPPTFILLPCALLADILAGEADRTVVLGGQAFSYQARPYLLPTIVLHDDVPAITPADATRPHPASPVDAEMSAADLIKAMETGAIPRTIIPLDQVEDPRSRSALPTEQADDGKLLVNRRARIVRLPQAGGRFGVTFDNDHDSPTSGPLVLLPCRALERLEATASHRGDAAAYTVSGRVYTFDGQSYLLPVFVQVQRQTDVTPMQ